MNMKALVVMCVHPHSPLAIHFDVPAQFRTAFFDFTGSGFIPNVNVQAAYNWSYCTSGKGEILFWIAKHAPKDFDFVAVMDDDVSMRVSDINHLLFLAKLHQLDLFQPSLTQESASNFPHLKQRPGSRLAATTFVEVMTPFFSRKAFDLCQDLFGESLSGWGIDIVWSDRIIKNQLRLAIVHEVAATHLRPINSTNWIMPNGETPQNELVRVMRSHGLDRYEVR